MVAAVGKIRHVHFRAGSIAWKTSILPRFRFIAGTSQALACFPLRDDARSVHRYRDFISYGGYKLIFVKLNTYSGKSKIVSHRNVLSANMLVFHRSRWFEIISKSDRRFRMFHRLKRMQVQIGWKIILFNSGRIFDDFVMTYLTQHNNFN